MIKIGMQTFVEDSDVKIVDLEGLKEFFEKAKTARYAYCAKELHIEPDANTGNILSFAGWDGWKIISYWYDDMVELLRDIAPFVEGRVYLNFENNDEGGGISFEDGKCIITTGQMQWQENNPEEFCKLNPLPEWIQQRLIARKL